MRFVVLATAAAAITLTAHADVGANNLPYLRQWHVGTPVSEVVRVFGPPDFAVVSTDQGEVADELREDGIPRELFWRMRGCGPVKMDVDSSGRTIGADYTSLVNPDTFCSATMMTLQTPAARFSCTRAERSRYCR